MNNVRLAQALVPIADELDERGLAEEAAILDEYISELMAEAASDSEMTKEAQYNPNPYGPYKGTMSFDRQPLNPFGGGTTSTSSPAAKQQAIAQIDQQIAAKLRELDELRTKKYGLQGGAGNPANSQYKQQMINPVRNQLQGAGQAIKNAPVPDRSRIANGPVGIG